MYAGAVIYQQMQLMQKKIKNKKNRQTPPPPPPPKKTQKQKLINDYGGLRHFQQYFSHIVAVSFIGGGNRYIRRKPPTYCKSLINFIA